jgi:DNA-binding GntR family transcriptional regulator
MKEAESATAPAISATDKVADQILERIREGDFVPGQRLVESSLAQEFGVSRGIIRQCLHMLSAANIVDIELHRGATIHRLSRAELREMYELRELIEGFAARKSAERADHVEIAANLGDLVEEMAPTVVAQNIQAYSFINTRFHDVIILAAGNTQLSHVLGQIHAQLPRLIYSRLLNSAEIAASDTGHRAIQVAIAKGDGEAAQNAMKAHVREAGRAMLTLPDKFFSAS